MQKKHGAHPVFKICTTPPALTFIFIIVAVILIACNLPANPPDGTQEFSDQNARMYQMYFDSSADPALNELQKRRFIGHLHLTDIEDIFGDIQSLPMDEDCNYFGGPTLHEGLIWYLTVTADLVGVNLVSVSPDGTRSSAFDLDGDRVVDILDVRLGDNRRFSFFTEQLGLDVFRNWLQGLDPFCNSELIRQLGLPELGCDERGDGSSGGGDGFAPGSGIIDPFDMICSEYDSGPGSQIMTGAVRANMIFHSASSFGYGNGFSRTTYTYVQTGSDGEIVVVSRIMVDTFDDGTGVRTVQIISETVNMDGYGSRVITKFHADGSEAQRTEAFTVTEGDEGNAGYSSEATTPPPPDPVPEGPRSDPPPSSGGTEGNPGPEGDDSAIAEFCQRRANHRSGAEQAASTDPSSMSVSCDDLVGAPAGGNCTIIEWARPEDFRSVLHPSSDNGCDTFQSPDDSRHCEPSNIQERLRGLTSHLWSLDIPEVTICPAVVCDPAQSADLRTYTAGGIEFSCPVPVLEPSVGETPTLVPSANTCPPGTYFAPGRGLCIQNPQGDGDGGSAGGGCNLSIAACSAQGQSFDGNKCECVDIQ